jgi:hypothetical protein
MVLSDNRIFQAVSADQIRDSKLGVVKYLNMKEIPLDTDEYYVVGLRPRKTKAGNKMMDMLLLNYRGELGKVVCFSKEFPSAYARLKEGQAFKMLLGATKDGSIVYRGLQ